LLAPTDCGLVVFVFADCDDAPFGADGSSAQCNFFCRFLFFGLPELVGACTAAASEVAVEAATCQVLESRFLDVDRFLFFFEDEPCEELHRSLFCSIDVSTLYFGAFSSLMMMMTMTMIRSDELPLALNNGYIAVADTGSGELHVPTVERDQEEERMCG
jgi:hypothetical protein